MATDFNADADALLREVKERSGEVIDVVTAISRPFVYKVLPDLLGLPQEGRENLTAFGHMVWATLGPQNEMFAEAMQNVGPVIEWVERLLQSRESAIRRASACRCSSPRIAVRSRRMRRSCWWASCCRPPRIPR